MGVRCEPSAWRRCVGALVHRVLTEADAVTVGDGAGAYRSIPPD